MGKRRWTNDLRVVKPVLEANGFYAQNNGHIDATSHTKFINADGNSISLPKSINRMLWRREVKRNNIQGGLKVLCKLKG